MKSIITIAAVGMFAAPLAANAVPFTFNCITSNNATDCGIGESQFVLDVTDAGGGSTNFRFSNTGPLASSIADVYFDWLDDSDALTSADGTISSSAGVSYSWGASPGNLPGGNPIGFAADLGADSNSPVQPNGVNPGEWVNFLFAASFDDLLASLNSGALRVGVHAQGFRGGGSESFVNVPGVEVPEPGTMGLLGLALAGLGLVRRRRTR